MNTHINPLLFQFIKWTFALWLSASPLAYGQTVTIDSISGVSSSDLTAATPVVYGGEIGSSCTGTTTCNTCDGADLTACNPVSVNPNTIISISFTTDGDAGPAYFVRDNDGTKTTVESNTSSSKTATLTFTWSELCASITGNDTTCSAFSATAFLVGIDSDNDGELETDEAKTVNFHLIKPSSSDTVDDCDSTDDSAICEFTAFPGDEKVFIKDATPSGSFPNNDDANFEKVRLYCSETGFDEITNSDDFLCAETEITSSDDGETIELNNRIVSGLENGKKYYFRIAHVDTAGNIMRWTSDTNIQNTCDCTSASGDCNDLDQTTCPYIAQPDKVLGILEEDLNCFVATAAFGSSMAPAVKTFRRFRSHILKTTSWGRPFVRMYYKYGPYGARFISHHSSWAKPLARTLLWPAWGMAFIWNEYGATVFYSILFSIFGAFLAFTFVFLRIKPVTHHQKGSVS